MTPGCKFVLHGMVTGDVVVEAGAVAELYGTVFGNAINAGGELQVLGRIRGEVRNLNGKTRIAREAIIEQRTDVTD